MYYWSALQRVLLSVAGAALLWLLTLWAFQIEGPSGMTRERAMVEHMRQSESAP